MRDRRLPASGGAPPGPLVLFGVPVHNVSEAEALTWILERARSHRPGQVVTSNLDFALQAWRDPEMHRIHLEAELVIPDGMPFVWFSRFLGPRLRERVAGSDLVPRLAEAARDRGLSLYAVGGAPGVAERALRILQERYPGLRVAGWESPPMAPLHQMDHEALLRGIREARPDILLVAFGAPKQDKWIRLHLGDWDVPVAIGVGGSLDFIAGVQSRAPGWIRRIGLEWLWRMAGQPRRLFKRYFLDFLFLAGMAGRLFLLKISRGPAARPWPGPDTERLARLGAERIPFRRLRDGAEAEAFFTEHAPGASPKSIVMDLVSSPWLSSLELGVLVRLARKCRAAGRRLCLVGASGRLRALLSLYRLDRYLDLPRSTEELERTLAADGDGSRLDRAGPRLRLILPEEFGGPAVERIRKEFLRAWGEGALREVVLDAGRMRYIDAAGARFLLAARRLVEREPGRSLWLRGFPVTTLEAMRRDGLEGVRVDRRETFREEPKACRT